MSQAVRVLREKNLSVVQGIERESGFMTHATLAATSTQYLLATLFRDSLPPLIPVETIANMTIEQESVATVFDRKPFVKIVRLGEEAAQIIRVDDDLWLNIDTEQGRKILEAICSRNEGHVGLWSALLVHAPQHAQDVAIALAKGSTTPSILGPVRRQYLRGLVR